MKGGVGILQNVENLEFLEIIIENNKVGKNIGGFIFDDIKFGFVN